MGIMSLFVRVLFTTTLISITVCTNAQDIFIRFNQMGYFPQDSKRAVVFCKEALDARFEIYDVEKERMIYSGELISIDLKNWDRFHHYSIDFSEVVEPGEYRILVDGYSDEAVTVTIGVTKYLDHNEDLLGFMRQQRCGYNPFLDLVCHQRDGRSAYGPMKDSTFVDASGGWHDAGDQLKYLITGSNATARMLLSYTLYPEVFRDDFNALGQHSSNGIPDILDEAKWGLDWLLKLHPMPDLLIHQVADDRDHRGWKMPDEDISDYGWGPNSYRTAYFATGQPQGLGEYMSKATGFANVAGRSAAALALGYQIWKDDLKDESFAKKCLSAAKSLYALGVENEGYQQGNSYGAPYRYNEDTWTDDMEWGAAELYKATGEKKYLEDAIDYAKKANTSTSWMDLEFAEHYRYYPFVNVGHFSLFDIADDEIKKTLASYYRTGIEQCLERSLSNPYLVGVPFIWCSNNLVSALITQIILYERMTGDTQFHPLLDVQRDWLFGTNSWGTSMFTGIPRDGEYPLDVHTSVWMMTHIESPGGLVDGPLLKSTHDKQLGIVYAEEDEFGHVQNGVVLYHDDNGDYATNEPTMDGTADAILMMAYWSDLQKQDQK